MRLSLHLELPGWVPKLIGEWDRAYPDPEERMRLAIQLARANLEHGTGGPFGAAVFESETHRLIAPGMNLVTSSNCSIAHAEIVALAFAQQHLGHFDLGQPGGAGFELVSSSEPCAMCYGALPWSGIRSLVCGARSEDACAIGFDEGEKPANWAEALAERGIRVTRDLCRPEAVTVLKAYQRDGGLIY